MSKLFLMLFFGLTFFKCSDADQEKSEELLENVGVRTKINDREYSGKCETLTNEEELKLYELQYDATKARQEAAEAYRKEKQLSALTASYTESSYNKTVPFPYPNAVSLTKGEKIKYEEGLNRYVLHTEMPTAEIFETEPGSKKYFIIDQVLGDGAGSAEANSEYFNDTVVTYGLNPTFKSHSWHSWHQDKDGKLRRLKLDPDVQVLDRKNVCGCGSYAEEISDSSSQKGKVQGDKIAAPVYGVFMLQENILPSVAREFFFIKFQIRQMQIHYVPKKGKQCQKREVVC